LGRGKLGTESIVSGASHFQLHLLTCEKVETTMPGMRLACKKNAEKGNTMEKKCNSATIPTFVSKGGKGGNSI